MLVQIFAPLVFSMCATVDAPSSISLQDAVAQDLIEISLESVGGHSGKCVSLHINSNSKKKYNLLVSPGDLFIPDDEGSQNILVVEEQVLAMTDAQDDFRVEGFCCEAHDAAPGDGEGFVLTKVKNEKLKKLASYISGKGIDQDNKQSAIWAVSDGYSVSDIYPNNEESKDLRKYVCDLTNQEDVWFNTKKNYEVNEYRQIVAEPVLITGKVEYDVKKPGVLSCSVVDADGNERMNMGSGSKIPYATKLSFQFQGKVQGWENGDYFVKVFIDGEEIHSQKFTV